MSAFIGTGTGIGAPKLNYVIDHDRAGTWRVASVQAGREIEAGKAGGGGDASRA